MQSKYISTQGTNIRRMIKAYPNRHKCSFSTETSQSDATLIAMNNKTARIRCDNSSYAKTISFGTRLNLRPGLTGARNIPGMVPCRVAWKYKAELGLEFDSILGVGIGELQRAFDT